MDTLGCCLRAGGCTLLDPLFAFDAEADQRADLAAELNRLVLGKVAEVLHFDLSLGVLVDGQRVDHAHGVALAQPFELGDDLAVELGMAEAENNELNRSYCHASPFNRLRRHSGRRLCFDSGFVALPGSGRPWLIQTSVTSSTLDETAETVIGPMYTSRSAKRSFRTFRFFRLQSESAPRGHFGSARPQPLREKRRRRAAADGREARQATRRTEAVARA